MLRPGDLVILLASHVQAGPWSSASLAKGLGVSPSRVRSALERARAAGLLSGQLLVPHAFLELATHGLRFVYPARPGERDVPGIPTSHSAPPLAGKIVANVRFVWPRAGEETVGRAIEPLDECVFAGIASYPALYDLLTLVDALRVGSLRERHLAEGLLKERLVAGKPPWYQAAL